MAGRVLRRPVIDADTPPPGRRAAGALRPEGPGSIPSRGEGPRAAPGPRRPGDAHGYNDAVARPIQGTLVEQLRRDHMHSRDIAAALESLRLRLAEEGIPFAVIGALALRSYGYVRHTEDIDILTTPHRLPAAADVPRSSARIPPGTRPGMRKTPPGPGTPTRGTPRERDQLYVRWSRSKSRLDDQTPPRAVWAQGAPGPGPRARASFLT